MQQGARGTFPYGNEKGWAPPVRGNSKIHAWETRGQKGHECRPGLIEQPKKLKGVFQCNIGWAIESRITRKAHPGAGRRKKQKGGRNSPEIDAGPQGGTL